MFVSASWCFTSSCYFHLYISFVETLTGWSRRAHMDVRLDALQRLSSRKVSEFGCFYLVRAQALARLRRSGWYFLLGDQEKPGATPPSLRNSPASLDTNAIASSATPRSKHGSSLALKDGHRGRSTASVVSSPCVC